MQARTVLIAAMLLGALTAVQACGGGEGDEPASTEEQYEIVDPAEFSFVMEDVYWESEVGEEDGELVGIPFKGEIGSLICNGQQIPLAVDSFQDGFLESEHLGKIKVRTGTGLGGGFYIYLTATQKKNLREFLAEQP